MVDRFLIEQVLGYIGLVFWSFQLAPQAYKTYRRKTTDGLSMWAMLIWALSSLFMGVYNIGLAVAVPLCLEPQIFTFIALICVFQEFRYRHSWHRLKTLSAFVASYLLSGIIQYGLIVAYKKAATLKLKAVTTLFGILPLVLVLTGFLPQFYDILRNRRAVGISPWFLLMDLFGAFFSTISLAYGIELNYLDLATYIAIGCFDVGMIVLYYFFEWYQKQLVVKQGTEYMSTEDGRNGSDGQ